MNIFSAIGGVILVLMLVVTILALPVMWLWDWLMPELFGLGEITFWQSLGLLMLCQILFTKNTSGK